MSGFALGPLNRIFLLPINGNSIWVLDRERSATAAGEGIDGSKGRCGLVMPQAEATFCCSRVEARLHFKLVHSRTQTPLIPTHARIPMYVHVGSMADPSFFSAALFFSFISLTFIYFCFRFFFYFASLFRAEFFNSYFAP